MKGAQTLPCTQSNLYTKIARLGLAGCGHMHHPTIRAGALVHVRGHMTPHHLLQGAAAGNFLENIIFGTTYIFRPLCTRSNFTCNLYRQLAIYCGLLSRLYSHCMDFGTSNVIYYSYYKLELAGDHLRIGP